jgi:selenocysteine-specific elongation factor
VDVVVLVVAADDGVMPQTREHIQILELLGLTHGLVALNKIDLVDEEMRELALMDIKEFLATTALKEVDVYPVSAETGEGVEELRAAIIAKVNEVPEPLTGGLFRMPAQRAFSKQGHGTVVTGVPLEGEVKLGEKLEVLPTGEIGKVRGIQALGESQEHAQAGHRAALQISDVGAKEVKRGMVVAEPGYFTASHFVEGHMRYLSGFDKPLKSHMRVRLHVGTAEAIASLVFLEDTTMAPGTQQLVQLRCQDPVVVSEGDRFVVRRESPMETLGGGVIVGTSGRKLRAKREDVLEPLRARLAAVADPKARVALTLAERGMEPVTEPELRPLTRIPTADLKRFLAELVEAGVAAAAGRGGRFIHADAYKAAKSYVRSALKAFHKANPLTLHADVGAIRTAARLPDVTFAAALETLTDSGEVVAEGKDVRLASHEVNLSDADKGALAAIETTYRKAKYSTPAEAAVLEDAGAEGERGQRLLKLLKDQGQLVDLGEGIVVHADTVAEARAAVIATCEAEGKVESSKFRDAIGTTRKYAIPLLEHFDRIGLTVRVDNARTLRKHTHAKGGGA